LITLLITCQSRHQYVGDNLPLRTEKFVETVINWAAGHANILPLTSQCNVSCVFCSNKQNPPGVEVFNIAPRTLDQVRQTLEFIDPRQRIIIGESATRINEGEPFTHPQIERVLTLIRTKLPKTKLQITTNGSLLDRRRIDLLRSLAPLTVYLSLNSADAKVRRRLMRDPLAKRAVAAAAWLGRCGLEWHGSVVAMSHLMGWDDLRATILYLAQCGARTVRVFVPGFTRLSSPSLRYPKEFTVQLRQFVKELNTISSAPVTMEPPLLNDLVPEVAGVLPFSPAHKAGVRPGDVIVSVNGHIPFSRVDAFHRVENAANPSLTLRRPGGACATVRLNKPAGAYSGLVMEYDLDPATVQDILNVAAKFGAEETLILTSQLAAGLMAKALARQGGGLSLRVLPVPSRLFGGSISTAGLLVNSDFLAALQQYLSRERHPDLVLLPKAAFDYRGRDLTGQPYTVLERHVDTTVVAL